MDRIFIKYPSIGQLRTAVKELDYEARKNGELMSPTLTVTASEKIHGTNMAFCMHKNDFWFQSRKNILTEDPKLIGHDGYSNMGEFYNFNDFLNEDNKTESFKNIVKSLALKHHIDLEINQIILFFEFAGGSVQRKSACSNLDKRCFIFQHFMVKPINEKPDEDGNFEHTWFETTGLNGWVSDEGSKIFNIMDFNTWEFTVDFSRHLEYQNRFIELVDEIEKLSPVGKKFGQENIGEGIVCTFKYLNKVFKFKVKGEKHAKNSKIKKLKVVDESKLKELNDFVNTICHDWRFEQGLTEVFGPEFEKNIDRKKISEYLKWISIDTYKEEKDLIESSKFTSKEIMSNVKQRAKEYFFAIEG